jgi:hypothetical protein
LGKKVYSAFDSGLSVSFSSGSPVLSLIRRFEK